MNMLTPYIYFDINKALSFYVDRYDIKKLYVRYSINTKGIELVIINNSEILGFALFECIDNRYTMKFNMFKNVEYFNRFGRLYLPEDKANRVLAEGNVYECFEE